MKKDDYKTEFEENRMEINLDEDKGENLPSRTTMYKKRGKPKKKSGHMTINVILGLFTLIPVLILIYVITDFYSDSGEATVKEEVPKVSVGTETKAPDVKLDDSKEVIIEKNEGNEKSETDQKKGPNTLAEPEPITKPASKPEPKPESKPTPKPESKPTPKPELKPKPKPAPKPTGKTHVVGQGETLYRIALNYYGTGSEAGVQKIKKANGLTSNNIRIGQKLIIP